MCDLSYAVLLERVEGDARTERITVAVLALAEADGMDGSIDAVRVRFDQILDEDEATNVRHIDPDDLALRKALGVA